MHIPITSSQESMFSQSIMWHVPLHAQQTQDADIPRVLLLRAERVECLLSICIVSDSQFA